MSLAGLLRHLFASSMGQGSLRYSPLFIFSAGLGYAGWRVFECTVVCVYDSIRGPSEQTKRHGVARVVCVLSAHL